LVYVIDDSVPIGLEYLPETAWADGRVQALHQGEAALEQWRHEHGLIAMTSLVQGSTVARTIRAARELDACMILCGSRRLSLTQRLWSSSVGSALAAAAHLPVGVIPD